MTALTFWETCTFSRRILMVCLIKFDYDYTDKYVFYHHTEVWQSLNCCLFRSYSWIIFWTLWETVSIASLWEGLLQVPEADFSYTPQPLKRTAFHIPQNLLPRKPANNHLKMYLLLKMVFVFFNVMLVFSNFSSHQKVRNRYRLVVIPVPSMAVRGKLISLAVIQPLGFLIQVEANNYQLPSLQTNMTRWWFQLDGGSNPWPMTRFKTCFYIYCLGGGNSNIF